jgi:hypothetical protein
MQDEVSVKSLPLPGQKRPVGRPPGSVKKIFQTTREPPLAKRGRGRPPKNPPNPELGQTKDIVEKAIEEEFY